MDLLVTHLDTYSRLGIPKLHHLVAFEAEDEVEEGITYSAPIINMLSNLIEISHIYFE